MPLGELKSKKDYIQTELSESGWNEKLFITREDLCARWGLKVGSRYLQRLICGRNQRGVKLPVFRLGNKTLRYKPKDVLEFEYEVRES